MKLWILGLTLTVFFHTQLISVALSEKSTRSPIVSELGKVGLFIKTIRTNSACDEKKMIQLFYSPLGYALIGVKPVACEEFSLAPATISALQELFLKSKEYILKVSRTSPDRVEICLIHKRSFLLLFMKNKLLGRLLTSKKLTPRMFLSMFKKSDLCFSSFCRGDTILEGTLLGFGFQNAIFWSRWAKLGYFLGVWPFKGPSPQPSPETIIMPLPGVQVPQKLEVPEKKPEFGSLYAEWFWLNNRKKSIEENISLSFIPLPAFFYWDEDDAPALRYARARDILGEILFSETCLKS